MSSKVTLISFKGFTFNILNVNCIKLAGNFYENFKYKFYQSIYFKIIVKYIRILHSFIDFVCSILVNLLCEQEQQEYDMI